jgi:hypothetical protein
VRSIAKSTTLQDFQEFAERLSVEPKKRSIFHRSWSQSEEQAETLWSLAPQNDFLAGTITFKSKKLKTRALEKHGSNWKLDDVFNGMAMLHCSENPELE